MELLFLSYCALNKSIVITVLKQHVLKVCLQVYRAKQTSIEQLSEKIYKTITRSTTLFVL